MDEIAILAIVGAAVLAGTAGIVFGRGTVEDFYHPAEFRSTASVTVRSTHVHEATTFDRTGWHCECGLHKHVYSDANRCVCGKTGIGKEWA